MAGGGTYKYSIPYNGELKKGLTVIGVDTEYGTTLSIAIYNGENWRFSGGNYGFTSMELANSVLSFNVTKYTGGPYYISVFQTENFPTE